MNGIVMPKVEEYLYGLLPQRDEVLADIEKVASDRGIPIVGPAVGRLLLLLARLVSATRVFEMGSAIGYSTIWLARGSAADGVVYYTDSDEENVKHAARYFERAEVSDKVRLLMGDALQSIDTTEGDFDLIFNDIDKAQYPEAFAKAYPRLRRGGLLVCDNALWYGKVAEEDTDAATEGIREFNRLAYSAGDLFTVILPIRDGVSVSLRL
jgi:predicted O-methyltransferase YrrM